jgi:hypothetical protein
MKISNVEDGPRQKRRDIETGMLIMISVFMLADGIGMVRHNRDFGWLMTSAGAISLLMWVGKALVGR